MRGVPELLMLLALAGCGPAAAPEPEAPAVARLPGGFPAPDRPVAQIVAPMWSSGPDRDAANESGQLIRALGVKAGMAVADIGAGSGYHSLRLSPAVGKTGVVYAEDIVPQYVSGLQREAERRKLGNIKIVIGKPDDPMLPQGAIDRAVLVHMYHEIESPYALLWNLAPAMKADGRVAVLDLDRETASHGTPPKLLKCEFEAVGYKLVSQSEMDGGVGYLAIFEPPGPGERPAPDAIKPCRAPRR